MSTNVTGSKEARDTGDDTVMPSVADHQDDLVVVERRSSIESGQLFMIIPICTQTRRLPRQQSSLRFLNCSNKVLYHVYGPRKLLMWSASEPTSPLVFLSFYLGPFQSKSLISF